jgi:hypothetical protein
MAGLLVIVADTAGPAVDRGNRVVVHKINDITKNRFGRGGQSAALVVIAPGLEVFPVGGIRVQRVLGMNMGDVGTCPN